MGAMRGWGEGAISIDHLVIEPEQPSQHDAIRALVEAAFMSVEHADGDEHLFVDRMRAGTGYVPELALVARLGGRLVGHILLTRIAAEGASAARGEAALLLAEVAVAADMRRRGVARRLIEAALARARAMGFDIVLLIGEAEFYRRFGFVAAAPRGIVASDAGETPYLQLLEWEPGQSAAYRGVVTLPR